MRVDGRIFACMIATCMTAMSAHAFSRDEAVRIYQGKYLGSEEQIIEAGDYLFVTVRDETRKSKDGNLKPLILSGQLKALTRYVGRPSAGFRSPFPRKINECILPLVQFRIRGCKSCVVDETMLVGEFKNVTAFELAALKKEQQRCQSSVPQKRTLDEWCELIDRYGRSGGDKLSRNDFLAELGCVDYLINSFGGVEWIRERVDLAALVKLYTSPLDCSSRESCEKILSVNPAESSAHLAMAKFECKEGDIARGVSRVLRGSIVVPRFAEFSSCVSGDMSNERREAFQELHEVWRKAIEQSEVLKKNGNPLWQYALNTAGHLEFGHSAVPEKKKSDALFAEAKTLFAKGIDLQKILEDLRQAIELSPGDAEKWHYYGAALRAAGKKYDALVVLNEAALLDLDNDQIAADLCLVCYQLGCRRIALGNAWRICSKIGNGSKPSELLDMLNKEFSDVLFKDH